MKFKKGDRVEIPLSKSFGCTWEKSLILNGARAYGQNYLYIVNINSHVCELHTRQSGIVGEKFLLEEVKLWSEESNSWETINTIQKINEEIKEKRNKTEIEIQSRTTLFSK